MYKHYQLGNGIRIITERIPHFQSVSIGFWFRAGSAYETPEENGLTHFIEHMLFKGTHIKTARQIAQAMDSIGGQMNAFTAKEYTCFYCKVMDEHIELALELLSDMLLNSVFDPIEIQKEKNVILEEIDMYDDSPEDLAHELLSKAYFGKHPLAMPILGESEQLLKYNRDDLLNYKQKFFTTDNLVIAVAGKFRENELVSLVEKYLGDWQQRGNIPEEKHFNPSEPRILFAKRDIEQYHISLSFPGIAIDNEGLYPLLVMNNLLGGGMSSRLFQKIREDRGLAYSVFSYPSNYLAGGMFSIYAGMKPEQTEEVLKIIMEEIHTLDGNYFTQEEFIIAKEQLKGNYILSSETTGSRMSAIGKAKTILDEVLSPIEITEKIDRVQPEDVKAIIKKIFQPNKICASLVGNEDKRERIWDLIKGGI